MFNNQMLNNYIIEYKNSFSSTHWQNEKYKWEAVQWFQNHWNDNAVEFKKMFSIATGKTSNLLASRNHFPKGMIQSFASVDPEATRMMFKHLFNENEDVINRIEQFIIESDRLLNIYGKRKWKNHFQDYNSVSTYLWLRFPDKYYIYKYSIYSVISDALGNTYQFTVGKFADNYLNGKKLYDEICTAITGNADLVKQIRSNYNEDCYSDKDNRTITIDFGYYLSEYLKNEYLKTGFKPQIEIGSVISNKQLVKTFSCGNMGGMRLSKAKNVWL